MLLGFAVLGLLMDYAKLPLGPFVLSFILGPMLELNLRKGFTYTDKGILPFFIAMITASVREPTPSLLKILPR